MRDGDGFRGVEAHRQRRDRVALRPLPRPASDAVQRVAAGYQPTCENMLGDFARRISRRLPEGVELHSLRLHETATSFAEWFAEDNR